VASPELDWPVALIASALVILALAEALNEMRAKNTRNAFLFLLAAVIFAILTFYADPGYRSLLKLPKRPLPLFPYALIASLLSVGLAVASAFFRISRVGGLAETVIAKLRQFDNDWLLRMAGLSPRQSEYYMADQDRQRAFSNQFDAELTKLERQFATCGLETTDRDQILTQLNKMSPSQPLTLQEWIVFIEALTARLSLRGKWMTR